MNGPYQQDWKSATVGFVSDKTKRLLWLGAMSLWIGFLYIMCARIFNSHPVLGIVCLLPPCTSIVAALNEVFDDASHW